MVLYIIWNPDPAIADLGYFVLKWYSFFFLSGFLLCYRLLKKTFQKQYPGTNALDILTVYVSAGTIVGARLGHCLFYDFQYYRGHVAAIFFPFSFNPQFRFTGYEGLASHGGLIGILASTYIFARKYHFNYLWILDTLSVVVPLAGACIRLGNLMNSEIIGKPSSLPWAFVFLHDDLIPRHPSQLYEALAYTAIFVLMRKIQRPGGNKPGYLLGCFLVFVFSVRFVLEFTKIGQAVFEQNMLLNLGQLLSVPPIITGLVLILVKRRNFNTHRQAV